MYSFFPGTRRSDREASKIVPAQKAAKASQHTAAPLQRIAASLIPSPRSVSDSAPPASPGSTVSPKRGSGMADLLADEDIKRHIWSLPAQEDLEQFTTRIEKAFKEDIAQLKADTTHLGASMKSLEQRFDESLPTISMLQTKCITLDQQIETLLCQLGGVENRSHSS